MHKKAKAAAEATGRARKCVKICVRLFILLLIMTLAGNADKNRAATEEDEKDDHLFRDA